MNLTIASPIKVGILKGVQILVVDNDRDSGVLYTIFLRHFGANVIIANSIQESLKIMTWFVPQIIICEIRFLGESIYTLLNQLTVMEADNRNHIPIIVTSTSPTGTVDQIPEIEFEGYLLKPIDLDKLVVMINSLILTSQITIPGKDGYWLIQKIRTFMFPKARSIAAIAFSGNTEAKTDNKTFPSGFQSYIPKPPMEKLLTEIAKTLKFSGKRSWKQEGITH